MRLVLVTLFTLGLVVGCSDRLEAREPSGGRPHVTVMTYNVNYGLAGDAASIEAIRAQDADVVLLQETTPQWQAALELELGQQYPHMAFKHCCLAGGLGVLSRFPFSDGHYIAPPKGGWFPGWKVVVQSPLGPMQILNVHLRPAVSDSGSVLSGYFATPSIRRVQIEDYFNSLEPELLTLIVGDFNEDADGQALQFLQQRGFQSGLPQFHGSAPTWRWGTPVGTIRSQLDHIVYGKRLEPLDVKVLNRGRSDHLPLVATLVLKRKRTEPRRCSPSSIGCW